MTPEAKAPGVVYVADAFCACIQIYKLHPRHNRQPVGELSGGAITDPNMITTDRKGNLWIANGQGRNVLAYPPGATSPSIILNDSGYCATDVAVGPHGKVYVANFGPCPGSGGTGNIVIYAKGSTTPEKTLTDPSFGNPTGIAVDANRNIFVTNLNADNASVGEFKAGSNGSYTYATLVSAPSSVFAGIVVDKGGNLVVANAFFPSSPGVNVYSPPNWTLTNQFGESQTNLIGLAFVRDESKIFVADADKGAGPAVYEYAYPSGVRLAKITAGAHRPVDAAVAPDAPLGP